MPFKSEKQKKLILAAANNPEFAEKVGFPQEKAKKFVKDSEYEPFKNLSTSTKSQIKSYKPKFSKLNKLMGK